MVVSCQDEVSNTTPDAQQVRSLVPDASRDLQIVTIPDITVDAWVDPCEDLPNTHVRYCDCNPNCCQQQTWYCHTLIVTGKQEI